MRDCVTFIAKAEDAIKPGLLARIKNDLEFVFPEAREITVRECFHGYSEDQDKQVVLGIDVRLQGAYRAHVVKLGLSEQVAADYQGWEKCVLKKNFTSRILLPVELKVINKKRCAVIYQDAYSLFEAECDGHSARNLETVSFWSIEDGKPSPDSIERVIRQVYGDLHRGFYRHAYLNPEKVARFYRRRLRNALELWHDMPWRRDLRRDALWLLCGHEKPDSVAKLPYVDAHDYVAWALAGNELERIPQTLVGSSHGDLHARNILVGVQRGEVEYPTVLDYAEMQKNNVPAWDFVKLETELKVRILARLFYHDLEARTTILELYRRRSHCNIATNGSDSTLSEDPCVSNICRIAFAFEFELLLAQRTNELDRLPEPHLASDTPIPTVTGNRKLDRTLAILLRIRREAAYYLGEKQLRRGHRSDWRDEYYFALSVYGLHTAKFEDYEHKRVLCYFAIVSAGVAAANVEAGQNEIHRQSIGELTPSNRPVSHRIPLVHAREQWKSRRNKKTSKQVVKLLDAAVVQFPHSIALLQEYALWLVETNRHEEVVDLLKPFESLCRVFSDFETLSRIGRVYKDFGDRALQKSTVPITALATHPAWQFYGAALQRYQDAFQQSREYYPGINVATMARIRGDTQLAREMADEVAKICSSKDLSSNDREERIWVLATEGEAYLIKEEPQLAVQFYAQALELVGPHESGFVQSIYNQICRLWWALGGNVVDPVVEIIEKSSFWDDLAPGPLGDCGYV